MTNEDGIPADDPSRDDAELERLLGAELRQAFPAEDLAPSPEQVALLRDHVASMRRRPARGRWRLLAAAAALLVAGAGIGVGATTWVGADDEDLLARGSEEFSAELTGPAGARVVIDGAAAPEGRIVTLRSDTLPVVPYEQFYELWFLTDEGGSTWVSAGTFHPDEEGNTVVVLHAAVDPSVVTDVQITREPRDGNPAPSGDLVARGTVDLID
ncbi:anti-sigma factor [Aeromicrobium sp. Leaf350]|uniref:anti-sigma factor n=1 Tax=Aeromicrobium sp. Leaf350 TaxID=2876565 RepID=UPI001E2886CD|nr:anti-sigma factor [Aeromicrobium sp. Leaf350]